MLLKGFHECSDAFSSPVDKRMLFCQKKMSAVELWPHRCREEENVTRTLPSVDTLFYSETARLMTTEKTKKENALNTIENGVTDYILKEQLEN